MTIAKVISMKNSTFVHKYLKALINKNDIAVDMTAGNGNDTFFLAPLAKTVYAFDINPLAIANTRQRTREFDNVILILDSHENVDHYLKEKAKVFIFNLGYLPNSNSTEATSASSSLKALIKAYDLLVSGGYLAISFYLGHQGGKDEYYQLSNYLINSHFHILSIYKEDKKIDEPITYIIKKP